MSRRQFAITPALVLRAYQAGLFPMAETRDAESLFWLGRAYLASGDSRGQATVAQARKTLAASPLKTHQRLAAADKPL